MNKDEIRAGLLEGRRLAQEEWSTPDEINAVDELVTENVAIATPWKYLDSFQCSVRFIRAGSITPLPVREPNN